MSNRTRSRRKRSKEITGTLRVNPRGFGFVEPGGSEPSLFVAGRQLRGFLDGDIVTGELRAGTDQLAGLTLVSRRRAIVFGDVTASGRLTVDPGVGVMELPVDPALPVGSCAAVAIDGDAPEAATEAAATVCAFPDPMADDAIAHRFYLRHRLPVGYTTEVLADAEDVIARSAALPQQRDLTGMTVITIDDDASQDLDDALSAQACEDGSIRIWVHIADVAAHIQPGTPIDQAAQECPTSVYLPQLVRHMLPPVLGAERLSLLPGELRDALTVEMRIDAEGAVRSVDVYESRIISRQRLSYLTVGELICGKSTTLVQEDVHHAVRLLRAAAVRLGMQRAARGGVDAWRVDETEGRAAGEDEAHELIERLMVATNEAVAAWLHERGMPVLYRAHPGIDDEAAGELERVCDALGMFAGLPRPVTPRAFAALAGQAKGMEHQAAFWDAVLSVMPRARYQVERLGHFGLGSSGYTHFTSPLRRYSDLLCHRIVKAYLTGERSQQDAALREMAPAINDVSRSADAAERDGKRAKALAALHVRQTLTGTVISENGRNSRVLLDGVGAVGSLDGVFPTGAAVRVRVRKMSPLTGVLELVPADTRTRPKADRRVKKQASAAG